MVQPLRCPVSSFLVLSAQQQVLRREQTSRSHHATQRNETQRNAAQRLTTQRQLPVGGSFCQRRQPIRPGLMNNAWSDVSPQDSLSNPASSRPGALQHSIAVCCSALCCAVLYCTVQSIASVSYRVQSPYHRSGSFAFAFSPLDKPWADILYSRTKSSPTPDGMA